MHCSKNPLLDPWNPRWLRSAILKIDTTSAEGGPIWIKFRRLVQNDMSTAVIIWSKSKRDVEFLYGGRLGESHGMSSQSHLPHYRVRAATWRIQCHDPRAMCHIAGCCTGRIQRHVVPEPRITLQGAATWWIHCHDSRATLQGAVTWRNQYHDHATLQGVTILSAILKIVSRHILLFFFVFF